MQRRTRKQKPQLRLGQWIQIGETKMKLVDRVWFRDADFPEFSDWMYQAEIVTGTVWKINGQIIPAKNPIRFGLFERRLIGQMSPDQKVDYHIKSKLLPAA